MGGSELKYSSLLSWRKELFDLKKYVQKKKNLQFLFIPGPYVCVWKESERFRTRYPLPTRTDLLRMEWSGNHHKIGEDTTPLPSEM